MAKKIQVYIYGEHFDRMDNSNIRMTVDLDLFERYLAAVKTARKEETDEADQAVDDVLEGLPHMKHWVLSGVGEEFEANYKLWKKGKSFGIFVEDGTYGFGRTKDEAKVAYLKVRDEEGNDDGDEW